MDDLVSRKVPADLRVETVSSEQREKYELRDLEIDSTDGRRMKVVVTLPTEMQALCPAMVAVAGHGGTRFSCYGPGGDHGYAHILAEKGYVTVSTEVGQHEVREESRTLNGERLWDLMRCTDLLLSLDAVDPERIGCAGLSLGGEMTMWLGAMDERVRAVVSSGFLTRMDQIESGHCMCWKFPGLRDLVDFADIYSLIAPRHLLCQNGWQEQPTWSPVPLAREAMKEIEPIYADMGRPGDVSLVAHDGGHEIELPSLLEFLDCRLARTSCTLIEGTK
jgi:acetyl esterase/lipase